MDSSLSVIQQVLAQYQQGQRYFQYLDIDEGSFEGQNLAGITFEHCALYVNFQQANLRDAQFLNGGIKTCDFRGADLTNARFEGVCVESTLFAGSITEGVCFINNSCYSQDATQADFEEWIRHLATY